MASKVVEISNVSKKFNRLSVLHNINLSINEKDLMAIIGPNGGGKSTLLKIIMGILTPDTGEVKVFGRNPKKSRNLMGYLPQHVAFDPDFPINVFDTVLSGRYHGLFKGYTKSDDEAVEKALKDVEIYKLRDRQISEISGGQMQRVFIARSIVREPKLLLMDEPMASIDPEMQNSFYELLSRLKEKMTIILISHDVGAVSAHVDKIACLNQELFYHGPVEGSAEGLEEVYKCPLELISHGIPHRVLRKHEK
ncbi:metal ABC transporter ATP-binding protein [Methanobacterium sp.]|uniref:metal ABC transporter ATP-binding protein n=1 Tax=Methanobacterium sp. TaxID=2164 RepID=UPI003C73866E